MIALLGMGIDTHLANMLISTGVTATALRKKTKRALLAMGLSQEQTSAVLEHKRPPIPEEVVQQLLHDSRSCCVICRGTNASLILHHIDNWAKTRSHDIDNLVVLCLEHHGEAHTRRELSRSLCPQDLRKQKELWLAKVRELDVARVLKLNMLSDEIWDYFNFARMPSLLRAANVNVRELECYGSSLSEGFIDVNGSLAIAGNPAGQRRLESLPPGKFHVLMHLFAEELKSIIRNMKWIYLPDVWTRAGLKAHGRPGQLFVDQGAYYFRRSSQTIGMNQYREVVRRAKGIRIQGGIDGYDSVSSSSYWSHLSGHKRTTSVGLIRDLTSGARSTLTIDVTYLGFGSCFHVPSHERVNDFVRRKQYQREGSVGEDVE